MAHRIISTEGDRIDFLKFVSGVKLPVTFEWTPGRDRSLAQNKLMWLWAQEAADQRGDTSRVEVQREWKLRHGVPILRADSVEFRVFTDLALKPLNYEQRMTAMSFVPVTSEFKVPQMVAFLDAIERECAVQGIRLTDPDPGLASYQERYRRAA